MAGCILNILNRDWEELIDNLRYGRHATCHATTGSPSTCHIPTGRSSDFTLERARHPRPPTSGGEQTPTPERDVQRIRWLRLRCTANQGL